MASPNVRPESGRSCNNCGEPATTETNGDPLCARCDLVYWNRDQAAAEAALEVLAAAMHAALYYAHRHDVHRLAANISAGAALLTPAGYRPEVDAAAEVANLSSPDRPGVEAPIVNENEQGTVAYFEARYDRDYAERFPEKVR